MWDFYQNIQIVQILLILVYHLLNLYIPLLVRKVPEKLFFLNL